MTLEHIQDQSAFNFIIFGISSRSFTLHGVRLQNAKKNRHNSFKIIPSGFCKWKQIEISGEKKSRWREQNFHFAPLWPPSWINFPSFHTDLLKDKERSWQGNTQLPHLGEKLNSTLITFYMSLPKILFALFLYFYYQRLPDLATYSWQLWFLYCNVYIRLSVHRENEHNSHLQPLLLIYTHGTWVQDSQEHFCCTPGLPGGLSPNNSSYIPSLWYLSGVEPGLALGTGGSSLEL